MLALQNREKTREDMFAVSRLEDEGPLNMKVITNFSNLHSLLAMILAPLIHA